MHTSFIVSSLLEREREHLVEPEFSEASQDPAALFEEARRRQRHRRRLIALGLAAAVVAGAYLVVRLSGGALATQHPRSPRLAAAHQRPIRVMLSAQNHHPRASTSPYVHWGYCVRVRTAAGRTPPSKIHLVLQILNGGTSSAGVGEVWLNKGYDNWCGEIGGETNPLLGLPHGKRLAFQAVVTAMGVTVKRSWPIVIR